jgi:L-aspartate oxidase
VRREFDVIVVGTGIAGLSAAIHCKEKGLDVALLAKSDRIEETNSNYAQGGIIARCKGDSAEKLEEDILAAGCRINNRSAVRLLAEEGPALVFDFLIDEVGVGFSHDEAGGLDYAEEAAHSARRILHYQDHTGDAIIEALGARCRKLGVPVFASRTAVDLITNDHHSRDSQELYREREVMGAYVLDNATGEVEAFFAEAAILATGGIGNIFQFTTNPSCATGDGVSMAFRAGADIINAEFVQFHPTALYHKDIRRFLISESLRGEGAKLVDRQGHRFMRRYSEQEELAPRDVVARAIFEEMARQGSDYMFLDLAGHYAGRKPIAERFSRIYETCLAGGIDVTREPIPVVPAAHYFCGGIKVDGDGRSSVRRLYAVGEVSCTGLHGANRLASTSLLEGMLWGKRAALHISANRDPIKRSRFEDIPDWKNPSQAEHFEPTLIYQDWNTIKMTMWNHAGIVRTRKGLERAHADLNYHAHRITKFYKEASLDRDIIELRNGIVTAQIVVAAAMHDERSVGCHFRKD